MGSAHRVVQLVNCSSETLLGAANAAGQDVDHLVSVLPREGTWVMLPVGAPDHGNVLTIDIPPEWDNTKAEGTVAPNFWARTGCRYDIAADIAQCETGGAGGKYDISKAKLGPPGGVTITEWTFDQGPPYHYDNFDISAVNGASLTVDIQAVGGNPGDPALPPTVRNKFWWDLNYPLAVHGDDLRANNRCPQLSQLQRSDLTSGVFAFVIIGDNGKPLGGDATVACFSNCGKYKFPLEPLPDCDVKTDSRCYFWKTFCAADGKDYGGSCMTDKNCPVNGACYSNPGDPGDPLNNKCVSHGFVQNKCPDDVCTWQWGEVFDGIPDYSSQQNFGSCAEVISNGPPIDPKNPPVCIGEDGIHRVFPHAYSWPSDPQTYTDSNNVATGKPPLYRAIFAPGGTTVPITKSVAELPLCKGLPGIYCYDKFRTLCSDDIKNGAIFAIARPTSAPAPQDQWSCVFNGAGNDGVICRWGDAGPGDHLCVVSPPPKK